jgi:Cellulase (glycosyl hydrolase family 5)/Putative collagen-binding domain of a collagenase
MWCRLLAASCVGMLALPAVAEPPKPLTLHADNPRYFVFRGKPCVLLTSGEHYGAVLNRDFDYVPYLDELQARGFNLTRTFSGTYLEVPGSFKIVDNTLAPAPKSYVGPWARSDQPGAADGGNQFDLTKWDAAYFDRLKDFVKEAGRRGIAVELVLFCTLYNDDLWKISPMRDGNNVNGVGKVNRKEFFALKEKELTAAQEAVARKLVTELKDFDNVYFEVCNEPYFEGVTREWQDHVIDAIVDAEKGLATPHLIAQNIANGSAKIEKPNPHVSIFNFHYATPPDAVAVNAKLGKAVADDETGFRGTGDRVYRTEAWDFFLAGGSAFSNLDYSFSCKHPKGTAEVTTSPGGGGAELRRQLGFLKTFLDGFDLVKMKPANDVLKKQKLAAQAPPEGGKPPPAPTARVLAEAGKQYAVYVRGGVGAELTLDLPEATYRAEWLNPRTGKVEAAEDFKHAGGDRTLTAPAYTEDIALRIMWGKDKP